MESDFPPPDSLLPGSPMPTPGPVPTALPPPREPVDESTPEPVTESAHDRHTREFEHSLEVLEDTMADRLVRMFRIVIPAFFGVILAAAGSYMLGGYMRDRADRRRIARALRRSH